MGSVLCRACGDRVPSKRQRDVQVFYNNEYVDHAGTKTSVKILDVLSTSRFLIAFSAGRNVYVCKSQLKGAVSAARPQRSDYADKATYVADLKLFLNDRQAVREIYLGRTFEASLGKWISRDGADPALSVNIFVPNENRDGVRSLTEILAELNFIDRQAARSDTSSGIPSSEEEISSDYDGTPSSSV